MINVQKVKQMGRDDPVTRVGNEILIENGGKGLCVCGGGGGGVQDSELFLGRFLNIY